MASLFDQVTGVDTDRQICLANGHQKTLNSLICLLYTSDAADE